MLPAYIFLSIYNIIYDKETYIYLTDFGESVNSQRQKVDGGVFAIAKGGNLNFEDSEMLGILVSHESNK